MERIVNKVVGHRAAADWDVKQQVQMTYKERMAAAKELRDRFYPADSKDVKEWHGRK